MKLAFEFADCNGIAQTFNRDKEIAGKNWLYGFYTRHNLSVRSSQKCSLRRMMGFNKAKCSRFSENLKAMLEEKKFTPHRIFNMDETGISTIPNYLPKVI